MLVAGYPPMISKVYTGTLIGKSGNSQLLNTATTTNFPTILSLQLSILPEITYDTFTSLTSNKTGSTYFSLTNFVASYAYTGVSTNGVGSAELSYTNVISMLLQPRSDDKYTSYRLCNIGNASVRGHLRLYRLHLVYN